jgi:hypothetical protein
MDERVDRGPRASPIPGQAPTDRERSLRAIAGQLTPLQALDTIDQASARIVAAVSLTATLAGAVGLVSASSLNDIGPGWSIPCVVIAGLSVVAAVIGTLPSRARLAPGELENLEAWLEGQVTRRSRMIHASAGLLVAAVFAAALPSLVAAFREDAHRLTIGLTATASGAVTLAASGDSLPDHATLEVLLTHGPARIAFVRQTPRSGHAEVHLKLCVRPGVTVRASMRTLNDDGRVRTVTITVPRRQGVVATSCRP